MRVETNANLAQQGVEISEIKGLYNPPMGYFQKPNGEVGHLPADSTRLDYYAYKGFKFLGLDTEIDRDQIEDRLKRANTRQQNKEKGGET